MSDMDKRTATTASVCPKCGLPNFFAGDVRPTVRDSAVSELAELVRRIHGLLDYYDRQAADMNRSLACRIKCEDFAASLRRLLER